MKARLKDSLILGFEIVGGVATVSTILGFSLKDLLPFAGMKQTLAVILRCMLIIGAYVLIVIAIWLFKGWRYRDVVRLQIGKSNILVKSGNIFDMDAWRVIPVDTHFDTVIDDVIVSNTSLHGQLVKKHVGADKIKEAVEAEAKRRGLQVKNGKYNFPLGTAIHVSGADGDYIMVAFTKLDDDFEAHTTMKQYEHTLMEMWDEIGRVYARNNVALPLLGSGITRFDDDHVEPEQLLKCMLCTLKMSKVCLNADISIVIYGEEKLPLYEYRSLV